MQFANHKVSASLLVTSSGIDIAVMLVAWFLSSVMFCFVFNFLAGREIAPNTGANATKFFTLATKS